MTDDSKPWTRQEQEEDAVYFRALKAIDLAGPARVLVAAHHLEDALPRGIRRELAAGMPKVVLLDAPTEAWAAALVEAVKRIYPLAVVLAGSNQIRKKPELTLAPPRNPTFAISESRAALPPAAVAGADIAIRIWPSPKAIQRTLRVLYGRSATVTRADLMGLDLQDIEFSLRPSGTAAAAVARMRRASRSRSTIDTDVATPKLSELFGFGTAMQIVREVARDAIAVEPATDRRPPSMLFHGRPGGGKTLLARSFARTVGLPFIQTSIGSWFVGDGHLGDVIKSARATFDQALASAPAVLFIDELDGLPDRATMGAKAREWWTAVITSVLLNIDRVRERGAGIILIAATNHVEHLDKALVRPGRFDKIIEIQGPQTNEEIAAIFRARLGDDLTGIDLAAVARLTTSPSSAEIVDWVAQARAVARADGRPLALKDLLDVVAPPDDRDPVELRATALHEAAHAVLGLATGVGIITVSIIRAGAANGTTILAPPLVVTRERLDDYVVATLAGRAADIAFGGAPTSGAAADLAAATRYVALAHGVFGLGDELAARSTIGDATAPLAYDLAFRNLVEKELKRLMARAQELVRLHEPSIEKLAELLLSRRVVTGAELLELHGDRAFGRIGRSVKATTA